jgi:hypothetical protein
MIQARPWKALLFLIALLFLAGVLPEGSRAGDEEFIDNDVELKEGVDYPVPASGTDQFLATGRIDRLDMENRVITIDEASFNLLPSTEYYTSVMGRGSVHLFAKGRAVGYIADRKGRMLSLWLID